MIRFILRWARYGGGDDHIFVEFGLQPAQFYRRVLSMLEPEDSGEVDPELRTRLITFCTRKLAQLTTSGSVDLPVPR